MLTDRLRKRIGYKVAPVVLAAMTLTGIGVAFAATGPEPSTGTPSGDPVSYADGTRTPAKSNSAGSAAQEVLAGLNGHGRVTGLTAMAGARGLAITVTVDRNDDDIATVWEAGLAAGALAEQVSTGQRAYSDLVSSARAVGPNSRGVPVTTHLGVGAARLGQLFGSPNDDTLAAQVRAAAAQYGLTVSDLQILHPLESALRVTLTVPDGAEVNWTVEQLRASLVGQSPVVEGIFIELVSPAGVPLVRSSAAYRVGEGGLWFAPGQDERFGVVHGSAPWS